MARRTPQLTLRILATVWMLSPLLAQANEPPSSKDLAEPVHLTLEPPNRPDHAKPPRKSAVPGNRKDRPYRPPNSSHQARRFEKQIADAPPKKRKALQQRYDTWKALPQEKKDKLRRSHKKSTQRLIKESNKALETLGLTDLPEQRKKEFRQQYIRERKQLEFQLRKEMQQERKKRLPALLEKLKAEFTAPTTSLR